MSPTPNNTPISHEDAVAINARLWEWARKRAFSDKEMSAAMDILKHYSVNNFLYPLHRDAANEILGVAQPPRDAEPQQAAAPKAEAQAGDDPAAVLSRLRSAGMLRGRNGQKAADLLERSGSWSHSQHKFAAELADSIEKSALVFIAVREMAESHRGGNFAESLVESFEEWGSYTQRQLDSARGMVERDGNPDPLEALEKRNARRQAPTQGGYERSGPRSDDDIPF